MYKGVHKTGDEYTNYALFSVKEQNMLSNNPVTYIPSITYGIKKEKRQEDD